jgi:hypothetical protein
MKKIRSQIIRSSLLPSADVELRYAKEEELYLYGVHQVHDTEVGGKGFG